MKHGKFPGALRRKFLQDAAALGGVAAAAWLPSIALAQAQKVKVGLMLPYTGTFTQLGIAITNGFKLAIAENGGKIAGREVEYFTVDDESDPAKAADNANRLVNRDKVDVLVGTVHSGVQAGMVKIARESGVLSIIPNAGLNAASGPLCAPNVFRTSFANSQTTYPMGKVMADRGIKTAVTLTWKYAAGEEMIQGFKDGFVKGGGKVLKELWLPFPNVEFQPLLTEIAALKPDAVFVFFAGGGAAKFLKDYQAAGLKGKIPLYGSGFLTDGVLEAVGDAAEGVETTLHYGDGNRHAAQQGLPPQLREGLQAAARRVRGAGLRRGAAPDRRPQRGEGRRREEEGDHRRDGEGADRQPARALDDVEAPTTRCRTCTCARWSARRTR